MSRPKNFLINCGVLAVSLFLALGFAEAVLRLTVYNFHNYPISPGPGSKYRIDAPEFRTSVRMNSHNLRGPEIEPKKEGEFRILCVGDSFTFGLGVEENQSYPWVLDSLLKTQWPAAAVINGSYGRYAKDHLDFLKKTGLGLAPDLVIVQVYIGNDIYDAITDLKEPASKNEAAQGTANFRFSFDPIKVFLKEKCVTLDFIWRNLVRIPYIDEWLFRANLRYNNRGVFLKEMPQLERKLAAIELDYLEKLDHLLAERDIRRVYLIAPSKDQVYMKRMLQGGRYDYEAPNKIFREFFDRKGFEYLDLLKTLESVPSSQRKSFYYLQDGHWTVKGNEYAARQTASFLMNRRSLMGS